MPALEIISKTHFHNSDLLCRLNFWFQRFYSRHQMARTFTNADLELKENCSCASRTNTEAMWTWFSTEQLVVAFLSCRWSMNNLFWTIANAYSGRISQKCSQQTIREINCGYETNMDTEFEDPAGDKLVLSRTQSPYVFSCNLPSKHN